MKCVDLCKDTIRIIGVRFSHNKTKQHEKNFLETMSKIQNVLKIERIRSLTLEGKIIVFKTLAISQIVMIKDLTEIIVELKKYKNSSSGQLNQKLKTKQYLPISKTGALKGLKNVDINKKIASLQCSWIKRLYDDSFHEWKLIPLKLIKKSFGDELKFHSNLSFNNSYVRHFPCFYKNILLNWKQYLSTDPETISGILSQNLWFNKHRIIDNTIVNFTKFSHKNINFVDQLLNESCQFKKWQTLKDEYHLDNNMMYFQWAQLIHAMPQMWKNKIKQNLTKNESNLLALNHHLIKLLES